MTIKQTILLTLASIGVIGFGTMAVSPTPVSAAKCGSVQTAIITCTDSDGKTSTIDDSKVETSGVWALLVLALRILTAGVGVLAVAGIVWGAVLYTTAGDKAEQTKKAVSIIVNVSIGIIAYGMMFLLLNFLIPGGVLTR